jgi:hypothetical protein
MALDRRAVFAEDLKELIPAPEPEAPDADAEAIEAVLVQAREYLGISRYASGDAIQEAFRDEEKFWEFFFPHYREDEDTGVQTEGAPFHVDLRRDVAALVRGEMGKEIDRACPREHAKSVIGSLFAPIYAAAHRFRRFHVLFSDTSDQAEGFLGDIRIELETNERLQAVFPTLCVFRGLPRNNRLIVGEEGDEVIFRAVGSGKSVRGARKGARRPDFIVLDDIENDEEVENPKRRRKKMTWFNKVVRKLGRAAVYLVVGTILHADSFLANRVRGEADVYRAIAEYPVRMDLWQEWEKVFHDRTLPDRESAAEAFYTQRRSEMEAGARVLWPAKFSLYELMVERAEDLASFLSERQNDPFDPAGSYFPEESLAFLEADDKPAMEQVRLSVGFWDPSRGTSKSDTSAAFRLDVLKDGRRFVSWGVAGQIPPEEIIETVVGAHKIRPFFRFGVEKVGLSNYDGDLQRVSRASNVSLPVHPVTPQGEKQLRIKSMRPMVVSGGLLFAGDLPLEAIRQIKYYGQHPNDDVWDAIQQASALADEFLQDVKPASGSKDTDPDDRRLGIESRMGERQPPVRMSQLEDRMGLIERAW